MFSGLNRPREVYDSPAPGDTSGITTNPLGVLLPFVEDLQGPGLEGVWCQNAGLLSGLGGDRCHGLNDYRVHDHDGGPAGGG